MVASIRVDYISKWSLSSEQVKQFRLLKSVNIFKYFQNLEIVFGEFMVSWMMVAEEKMVTEPN
jgi:hypothetical protein